MRAHGLPELDRPRSPGLGGKANGAASGEDRMKSVALQTELDVERIRADFPILHQTVHGKPLVFLDSAASSQKPIPVIEMMNEYYRTTHANVHRGIYQLSEQATALYEEARRKIAAFIGAASPKEIIFTRNTTEAINLVAYAWARGSWSPRRRGSGSVTSQSTRKAACGWIFWTR